MSTVAGQGQVASPALSFAGGRATLAWGEKAASGWQSASRGARRRIGDPPHLEPRSALRHRDAAGRGGGAGGDAAALTPASFPNQPAADGAGPVRATTLAAGAVAWEPPVTLDPSGREASVSIADGGTVVAAWRRGLPATGVLVATRAGLTAAWDPPQELSPLGFAPTAAAGPSGHGLVAYGIDLDEEAGGPDPAASDPRGQVLRARRRAPAGPWAPEETVFAVADQRNGSFQRADGVQAAVDGLGTALLAWQSMFNGFAAAWTTATAAALPFGAPARPSSGDAIERVSLAPSGKGEGTVMWAEPPGIGRGSILRSDRVPAAACAAPPTIPPSHQPDQVTLSAAQLRINQRIYSAAIRRAGALDGWLAARIASRDLCGGGIGASTLGQGVTVGPATVARTTGPATPRPLAIRPPTPHPDATFALTVTQLRINQRIASRAVRRANALVARLDGGLSGGDVRDGAVEPRHIAVTIAIDGLVPAAASPPTRTVVAPATPDPEARFTLSAEQLRINQRIGQAAIRRLNDVRSRLLDGISGDDLKRATLTQADLAPGAGADLPRNRAGCVAWDATLNNALTIE